MSHRIRSALNEHFILRMENWALVSSDDGPKPGAYAASSIFSLTRVSDAYGYGSRPRQIGDAEDTDRALRELPIRYRQAVSLFWQYPDRPLSWMAWRSGQGVDEQIFETRVMRGHDLLRAELIKQREKMDAYRMRLRYSKKD